MDYHYAARRHLEASLDRVFDLIADPASHHRFDATGMVGSPVEPTRLSRVGQVFSMQMTYSDGAEVEHYVSDNHVVAFRRPEVIGWATATHDGPPLGWTWTYQLDPTSTGVWVTLTYDWSGASAAEVHQFGVPLTDQNGLDESLRRLAVALKT